MTTGKYVPLEVVAERLGLSYRAAYDLVRRTAPAGTVRTATGRWLLTEAGIEDLRRAQQD